jgi:hypothetical protein
MSRFTKENSAGYSEAELDRLNAQFDAESKSAKTDDDKNAVANRIRDEFENQRRLQIQPTPNAPQQGPTMTAPTAVGIPPAPDTAKAKAKADEDEPDEAKVQRQR